MSDCTRRVANPYEILQINNIVNISYIYNIQ
jgi:hypothetical protein